MLLRSSSSIAGYLLSLILLLLSPSLSHSQILEERKSGVVKITARVSGHERIGTGFIVNLQGNAAYIVTVSDVVENDSTPQVAFFSEGLRPLTTDTDGQVRGGEESKTIGFTGGAGTPRLVPTGTIGGRKGSQY
jgi:hypothetical protein